MVLHQSFIVCLIVCDIGLPRELQNLSVGGVLGILYAQQPSLAPQVEGFQFLI